MLIYVLVRLPRNVLTLTFSLTLMGLIGWQCSDTILRIVESEELATRWNYALMPSLFLVSSAGLHFALLFTHVIHKRNFLIPLLIYLPMVGYDLCNKLGVAQIPLKYDQVWGYIQSTDINLLGFIQLGHAVIYAFLIIIILGIYTWKVRHEPTRFKQTLLVLIGFLIPTLQGSITQFIFPHIIGIAEIPVTSTAMSAFTVSIFIALWRFDLFNFEPEEEAEKILATMNDGLCAVDSNNKIQFTNERFREMFGYTHEELLNSNLYDYLHASNYQQEIDKIMLNRAVNEPGEYYLRFLTKDGDALLTHMRDKPIVNYRQNVSGWMNVITDISKLEETLKQLRNKNKELSTFFHRTSHDLRGPLTSMMGLISILQSNLEDSSESGRLVSMLEEKSTQLDQTLEQLITIANVNDSDPKPENVHITQLVGDLVQKLVIDFPDKEIEVTKNLEFEQIYTDKYYLRTILYNLFANAVIFNENPRVEISLQGYPQKGGYQLTLTDNGMGIHPKIAPHIYKMFVKGDREKGGAGLGLYLVKIALEKVNGNIDFISLKDGTAFQIYLREYKKSSHPAGN